MNEPNVERDPGARFGWRSAPARLLFVVALTGALIAGSCAAPSVAPVALGATSRIVVTVQGAHNWTGVGDVSNTAISMLARSDGTLGQLAGGFEVTTDRGDALAVSVDVHPIGDSSAGALMVTNRRTGGMANAVVLTQQPIPIDHTADGGRHVVVTGTATSIHSWTPVATTVTIEITSTPAVGPTTSVVSGDDHTGPELVIVTPVAGETVDQSHGELDVVAGTVVDPGSGLASITATAPDGSAVDEVAVTSDGKWGFAIAAPVSGPATFTVIATDVAGNSTTEQVTFDIVALGPTGGTVVRPTTIELTPELVSDLVEAAVDSLRFSGDAREALAGRTVIISAPSAAAPSGLLRYILAVDYDEGAGVTTVTTEPASLADAFAEFELDATGPPPGGDPPFDPLPVAAGAAGLRAMPFPAAKAESKSAPSCESFGSGSRFQFRQSLSTIQHDPWGGALTLSGGVTAYADVSIDVKPAWSGIGVKASISAGVLACADISYNSGTIGQKTWKPKIPAINKRLGCVVVYVIPVCPILAMDPGVSVVLDGTVSAGGHARAGREFKLTKELGEDSEFTDSGSLNSLTFDDPQASAKLTATVKPSVNLGLEIAGAIETGLLSASIGPVLAAKLDSSGLHASLCVNGAVSFTPSLTVKLPLVGKKKLLSKDVQIGQLFDNASGEGCISFFEDPATTTTTDPSTTTTTCPPQP